MTPVRVRHVRVLVALGVLALVIVLGLDVPHATRDFTRALDHLSADRLPWLCAAIAVEACSVSCFALVQRQLLAASPHRLRLGSLLRLSIAALGLQALLPVGTVPSGGWLVAQYRRMRISTPFALYVVAATFFAALVSLFGILLLGALLSGIGTTLSLWLGLVGLVTFSAVAVGLAHRLGDQPHLAQRFPGARIPAIAAALRTLAAAAHCRIGVVRGARVFGLSAGTWLFDCACMACAFQLVGLPIPWRGLLLAYALAQVAGGAVPLPGGLGAVEGGAVGGLVLMGMNAGDALAAILAYRVISYWGEGLVGVAVAIGLSRRPIRDALRREAAETADSLDLHPAGSALEPTA